LAVVWIAVDSINKLILGIRISFERTILVAELFLNSLVKDYGKHSLFQQMGRNMVFIYACKLLGR
jgi:transposase-like protein